MNELSAFERRLAAGLEAVAGPRRSIDAIAIARTAASRAPVQNSILSRFSAVIGQGAVVRGRRLGGLAEGRTARPLVVLIAVALISALALGALAVGSGLVRLPSVAPSPEAPLTTPIASSPAPTAFGTAGSWIVAGDLQIRRVCCAAATLLHDGRILLTGGSWALEAPDPASTDAEVYDPVRGTWTETGQMIAERRRHSMTTLPDGRVLVAGGSAYQVKGSGPLPQRGAELYDPTTSTWAATGAMTVARADHSATLLADGTVLVVGGWDSTAFGGSDLGGSAEIYDPGSGAWSSTSSLTAIRAPYGAALLPDGRVLVVGSTDVAGGRFDTAETYKPGTRKWTQTARPAAVDCRPTHVVSLLDGKVLVVCLGGRRIAQAEVYDPTSDSWAPTGQPIRELPGVETATRLVDGTVLVGDIGPGEAYDPTTGTWQSAALPDARAYPGGSTYDSIITATLLPDGRVLMTDGRAAFLYTPAVP